MSKKNSARHKALVRRRIFLFCCCFVLILVIVLAAVGIKFLIKKSTKAASSDNSVTSAVDASSNISENTDSKDHSGSSGPDYVQRGDVTLDANFTNLLLVNDSNPLPEDYDYEKNFITIPNEYLNNNWFKQTGGKIDKDVWPYMKAMIDAAWADNVKLYIWSPYRSYDTQKSLFQNQVNKLIAKGKSQADAEKEAATVVARPGTSEHHTGLAADFNMADDQFEQTEMFNWINEHGADYGFIMRYSGDKQDKTGVIHESWHYRFVGINTAKEMNRLGMCLEEYVEYKKTKQ